MALDSGKKLKASIITREWPPEIYGGAGVHVTNLVAAIKSSAEVEIDVRCFGSERTDAISYQLSEDFAEINTALKTLLINLDIAKDLKDSSLVHSHTWYANFAGLIAGNSFQIPHVITSHSLEPLRPWKASQLGGGYKISSWIERLAYSQADRIIAVSEAMRRDILNSYPEIQADKIVTIRNGIDYRKYAPSRSTSTLNKYSINFPFAIFVGRITKQKGLIHLLRAWRNVPSDYGLVIAATSADDQDIFDEVSKTISGLQQDRDNVLWIRDMLHQDELIELLSNAVTFVCPSIYEPLGIVNLEAMACETAVVASKVGGIPEVVIDHETGLLVPLEGDFDKFEIDLANSLVKVLSDKNLAKYLGSNGRARVVNEFGWDMVATKTINLYRSI